MAITTGYVQRLTLVSNGFGCAWVGETPSSAELLYVLKRSTDDDATVAFNRTMLGVLLDAQFTGRELDLGHADGSAEITSVATTSCNVNQTPLQLDSMEVTQAVQDLSHSIPLVANKKTIVRLYLSYYASPGVTVNGEIAVRRGPSDPGITISSLNSVFLDPLQAGNLPAKRDDESQSLNFLLPNTHTTEGPLAISISCITNLANGVPIEVGCERRPTVWFHPTPPLRIRVLRMRYAEGNPPVTHTPSLFDYQALISWLGRAYPVGQVIGSESIVDVTGSPFIACAGACFGCGNINAQIAAIRALDMSAGGDRRTHYYGMVSDGGFFMRGCAAGIPFTPDPSVVASGPTGTGTWGWDFDGSYGDWYGGHELGHTFGRLHPGFCTETKDDLNNYPFANGQLADTTLSFAGFDVGDSTLNFPLVALPGTLWHDVMTYCNYQWLSAYTYLAIRERLLAEDLLGSGAGAGLGAAFSAGGRPDERFPQQTGDRQSGTPPRENVISVVATVNLTRNQGKILYVNPVPNVAVSAIEQDSPAMLRVRQADGAILHEYPVQVKLSSELAPGEDRTGLVDAVIGVDASARVIELIISGQVVDTYRAKGEAPALRAVRHERVTDQELGLTMDFEQQLEENQTYSVQISTDNGQTWQTIGVGLRDPSYALDISQFGKDKEIRVRVKATDGFLSRIVSTETIQT